MAHKFQDMVTFFLNLEVKSQTPSFSEAFLSNRAEPERQPVTVDKLKYTSFVLSGQRRNSFFFFFAEKRRALGGEKSLICIQNGHK